MPREKIQFVTGRLAEHALRSQLETLAPQAGFEYVVQVLPITVAALMTPDWIAQRFHLAETVTRVLIPGYCEGDLTVIQVPGRVTVEHGPRDLRQLPEFFGQQDATSNAYGTYDIEILAEINHAPQLALPEILAEAGRLKSHGADVIDVGCDPAGPWSGVGDCVKALRDAGHRVSIDSMDPAEIGPAVRAGAELVLSVDASNRQAACDWGCEVVVVPDDPVELSGLRSTVEMLTDAGVRLRIDPILEPIGTGLAHSLGRYLEVRRQYPDAEMMMGIGNLTELTDADSSAINVLLLGICQELGIRSVLTTQVIPWARSTVQECDLARRLVHYAVHNRVPAKHIEPRLIALRDAKVYRHGGPELDRMADQIKDHNYRIFAEGDALHLVSAGQHIEDEDPFRLFGRLMQTGPKNVDASHAFYLGYELAKAATALALGKNYRQDEALDWGYLTVPETNHRLERNR